MTMKSVYIVYITNCFLWTMSDNKTHRIVSYRIESKSDYVFSPICIDKYYRYSFLHVSHLEPVKPSSQRHRNPCESSCIKHTPPFRQGFTGQAEAENKSISIYGIT